MMCSSLSPPVQAVLTELEMMHGLHAESNCNIMSAQLHLFSHVYSY